MEGMAKWNEEWVCLIGKNNIDTMVRKVKFAKRKGERMKIEGVEYVVVGVGTRNEAVSIGNEHIAQYNRFARNRVKWEKNYWN
jgi:hypothetical protein